MDIDKITYSIVTELKDINSIEEIEKNQYGNHAIPVDVLVPLVEYLGFIIKSEYNGEIIGYTAFAITENKDEMYCVALTVLPNYRQNGIGSMLLQEAESICLQKGINHIIATGSPNNEPSHKTFLNSQKWHVFDIKTNLYKFDTISFVYKKYLNRQFSAGDSVLMDLSKLDQILLHLSNNYVGVKMENNKLLLKKVIDNV